MSQATGTFREHVTSAAAAAAHARTLKQLLRWGLMAGGALALVIGGAFYWLSGGRRIDTDDAYLRADSTILSTDVSGVVASIPVDGGKAVTKGQMSGLAGTWMAAMHRDQRAE